MKDGLKPLKMTEVKSLAIFHHNEKSCGISTLRSGELGQAPTATTTYILRAPRLATPLTKRWSEAMHVYEVLAYVASLCHNEVSDATREKRKREIRIKSPS